MDFIRNYALANSGTMVSPLYTMWCSLFLLSAGNGRRCYVDHGHFKVFSDMYAILVGLSGTRKSAAIVPCRRMWRLAYPESPIGPSITSPEDIVLRMATNDSIRVYDDENGKGISHVPYTFFINEFKNFIRHNEEGMITFLTDIYGEEHFNSSTIKHGLQPIENPVLNLIGCATPQWIEKHFKKELLTGGWGRRVYYIFETQPQPRITFPIKTKEACEAEIWCINHLQKIAKLAGKITFSPEAREFLDKWNMKAISPEHNEVVASFLEVRDILVTRLAIALCLAYTTPVFVISLETLVDAIGIFDDLAGRLPKLTSSMGRNELTPTQNRLIQLLKDNNGRMAEFVWHRIAGQDLTEAEYISAKNFLRNTRQIVEEAVPGKGTVVFLTETAIEIDAKKKAEEAAAKDETDDVPA